VGERRWLWTAQPGAPPYNPPHSCQPTGGPVGLWGKPASNHQLQCLIAHGLLGRTAASGRQPASLCNGSRQANGRSELQTAEVGGVIGIEQQADSPGLEHVPGRWAVPSWDPPAAAPRLRIHRHAETPRRPVGHAAENGPVASWRPEVGACLGWGEAAAIAAIAPVVGSRSVERGEIEQAGPWARLSCRARAEACAG